MTAKELLVKAIKEKGADGLCTEDCSCTVDDLIPCGEACDECVVAYKHECYYCIENIICFHAIHKCEPFYCMKDYVQELTDNEDNGQLNTLRDTKDSVMCGCPIDIDKKR